MFGWGSLNNKIKRQSEKTVLFLSLDRILSLLANFQFKVLLLI